MRDQSTHPAITIASNGPYGVSGEVTVIRRRAIEGPGGHPERWEDHDELDTSAKRDDAGTLWLCRCGHSNDKPFCDGSHRRVGFEGTETAPTTTHRERAKVLQPPEGVDVVVRDDVAICEHAGFCVSHDTSVWKLVKQADDQDARELMERMIDHCPSGRLSREVAEVSAEPDLPMAIGVIDDGPLSVTGGIEITRSDSQPIETRNRVTLCRCGASRNKPLCDGTHAKIGFADH